MAELSDYEIGLARQKAIEGWPLAADVQQQFVNIVRPVIEDTNDLLLLEKWTTWYWSRDPQWKVSKVIEIDASANGVDLDRLRELVNRFQTAWRDDLEIEHIEWFRDETNETNGWRWRTLADAYEPKEPRAYVVSNILPLPSLSVFYGAPGGLKSMLVMDLALCVAMGKPWLEGLPESEPVQAFDCQQAATLWLDLDNGEDRLSRRFAALGRTHDVLASAPLAYISFPSPPFIASNSESIDQVVNAATATNAKLIVVDNLGAVSGGADENSSQMVEVMSGLRWLTETTGAAVVTIHHRTKADKSRKGTLLRGHSSINSALDLALFVEREEGTDTVTIQSTKSRDAYHEPFQALWTFESDGADLIAGRFYGLGSVESETKSKRQKTRNAILAVVEETPGLSQSAIVKAVAETAGRGLVLFVLKALIREGQLETKEGNNNAILHYLK